MKISVLGSGSGGNATLLLSESTRILVDAGFSARQLALRMEKLSVAPESIDAIVLTHDHTDHCRGVGVFSRRFGTPLFMTRPTHAACDGLLRGAEPIHFYEPGRPFQVGDFRVDPFVTAHDAIDPVAVTVTAPESGTRVGVATDLGRPTAGIRHSLANCDFLILEANHCEALLRSGPYPPSVQSRIASSHGHLSNHAAARFAKELIHPRLVGIMLAHLSRECNTPELARSVVEETLRSAGWKGYLAVAGQDEPTGLVDIPRLHLSRERGQFSLF